MCVYKVEGRCVCVGEKREGRCVCTRWRGGEGKEEREGEEERMRVFVGREQTTQSSSFSFRGHKY